MVQVAEENARTTDTAFVSPGIPCSFTGVSTSPGKLDGQVLVCATPRLPLLRVAAKVGPTTVRFVIDTGAGVSILPKSAAGSVLSPSIVSLSSASGSAISVFGEVKLNLVFSALRRIYSWTFVVADVVEPILGNDFLSHYRLVVDCSSRCLRDTVTTRCSPVEPVAAAIPCLVVNDTSMVAAPVRPLLREFQALISPLQTSAPSAVAGVKVHHTIDTGSAAPVHASRRRFSPEKQSAIKREIDCLLKDGIVRPSSSCWSSPVHLVPKADGGWRLTGDYRCLNAVTKRDCYPIPHIHDCSAKLRGSRLFSKLDLLRAYHQVPVAPDDIPKTAVDTPAGLVEYLFMPYGMRNSPATFQ